MASLAKSLAERAKIFFVGLVALLLVIGTALPLAGCSGSSNKSGDPIKISIKVPTLTMQNSVSSDVNSAYDFLTVAAEEFSAQYDRNVDITIDEFEIADEEQALSVTIGTPDAPDVLYEGYFNMSTYIHSGTVVPLDDIISDEVRADIPESFWESSRLEGKTYMMPFLHSQNILVFNKDMFENAGLTQYIQDGMEDTIQTWSLDEWDSNFAALRSSLPATSYPMMMYAGDNQGDTHIMTLLRSRGCDFYDENNRFHVNTPEGIAALQWIKDCADKGYFPRGCESLVITDNYQLFVNEMLGIYMNNVAQGAALRDECDFDYYSVNFPAPEGGLATSFITGFEVFDNGDADKVQVAKDFVKYIYESDLIDYSTGGIPVSTAVAKKYADELDDEQKYINNADAVWNFTGNHPNWRDVRAVFYEHIYDLLFGSATPAEVAAAIDEDCNAAIDAGYEVSNLHE